MEMRKVLTLVLTIMIVCFLDLSNVFAQGKQPILICMV